MKVYRVSAIKQRKAETVIICTGNDDSMSRVFLLLSDNGYDQPDTLPELVAAENVIIEKEAL